MQDNTNLTLQTARLNLRDFREEDWRDVHEYGSDLEVVKYMPFGPNTEEDTKAFINRVLGNQKEKPRIVYNFALVNKQENKLIGACAVTIKSTDKREGEIGYILNRRYWNRGYMTEAARKVVDFGFQQLGLHRVIATCDPANTGSYRIMEKVGMQKEGYLREHKLFKGVWRDFLLYSILEKEWVNRKDESIGRIDEENDGGNEIEYLEKNQNDLDIIRPLWE